MGGWGCEKDMVGELRACARGINAMPHLNGTLYVFLLKKRSHYI